MLDPADVEGCGSKVHLVPAEVDQLGNPEAVAIGDEDHGGVTVSPSIAFGGLYEQFHFGFRQVLTGAQDLVGKASRSDCSINGAWSDELQVRFGHCLQGSSWRDCSNNAYLLNSRRDGMSQSDSSLGASRYDQAERELRLLIIKEVGTGGSLKAAVSIRPLE